jgi:hypothetical protein
MPGERVDDVLLRIRAQFPESAKAFLHDYEMLRIASICENRDFCDISNSTISEVNDYDCGI